MIITPLGKVVKPSYIHTKPCSAKLNSAQLSSARLSVQCSAESSEESDLKWNGGDFGQNNYPLG